MSEDQIGGNGTAALATGVLELRQYTLHPQGRDALIEVFEAHFIDSQEAVGAQVLGSFRDLDDPDRFVWLRGFADMATRADGLTRFYGGPVWRAHRDAANATMLDSDNVLLLHPDAPRRSAFDGLSRAGGKPGVYGLTLHDLADVDAEAFAAFFASAVTPALEAAGLQVLTFRTAGAANNFPPLPIRERDRVFGWLGRWDDEAAMQSTWRGLDQTSGWRERADGMLMPALMRKPERLRLAPTTASRLR